MMLNIMIFYKLFVYYPLTSSLPLSPSLGKKSVGSLKNVSLPFRKQHNLTKTLAEHDIPALWNIILID